MAGFPIAQPNQKEPEPIELIEEESKEEEDEPPLPPPVFIVSGMQQQVSTALTWVTWQRESFKS